jgi:hypothetical protein
MASLNAGVTANRLVDVFDSCIALQARYLIGLEAGCLTEIGQWLEEQQAMVAGLRQALAGFQSSGIDDELQALLLDKLSLILSTEKVLFTLAEQQRSILSEKITVLRRGKRTLVCYGSVGKNTPPQLVSDKG